MTTNQEKTSTMLANSTNSVLYIHSGNSSFATSDDYTLLFNYYANGNTETHEISISELLKLLSSISAQQTQ